MCQEAEMKRNIWKFAAVMAALLASCANSWGQAGYPDKPVRIILGNTPGGTSDLMWRSLQVSIQASLGQQIVIEYRTGGAMTLATNLMAKAPPDGYTIGTIISTHAANVSLMASKLPYDTIKDFTFIAMKGRVPNIVAVHPSIPVNSMQELLALAKAKPGYLHHGTSGNGSSQHFAGEMLKQRTGVDIIHIPYRGGSQAIADLVGGQIEMMFGNFASILPNVKAGKVKPLAVTGATRNSEYPNLPTVAEALNLPGYEVTEWFAVVGPKDIPKEIVAKLNTAIYDAIKRPETARRFREQGIETVFMTPDQLESFVKAEIVKLGEIARQANMKVD
jgi:tripartite-type tricarboxylate transporter receptor subunit TctC